MQTSFLIYTGVAVVALIFAIMLIHSSLRYVGNNSIAIVEKLWSRKGSITNGLIALHGEAGFQPDVLRGGYHSFMPFQYRVHRQPLVTIPQGQIGYVFARDGRPLGADQTLASNEYTADFLDVRAFLTQGGQKGPQRTILREGTYALNLAQFVVLTQERTYGLMLESSDTGLFEQTRTLIDSRNGFHAVVLKDTSDMIGIVTVHDGLALSDDHIIAPQVGCDQGDKATFHNSFQDPEKFIRAGGRRGRQLQVLVEGTYYLNCLFATIEQVSKTIIEVGHVGVVVSYTGATGVDSSGDNYRHGELVGRDARGVWKDPLLPGKYAFNTYAGTVRSVPTTNFILKWEQSTTGQHMLDENLSEISLITRDAFEPTLPLSVVVHIDYRKAPMVIQRFGDVKKLVEQTLDPMVSAFFKNVGQRMSLIELLQQRSEIQERAAVEMRAKFSNYDLELQEVLIGTPRASKGDNKIEQVLEQLRLRQVAEERVATYEKQKIAADAEKNLREAEARASEQSHITKSELSIIIGENEGRAAVKRAEQSAAQTRTLAAGESSRLQLLGEGESSRAIALAGAKAQEITLTGNALAETLQKQVEASGGPEFQLRRQIIERIATALETSKVDIVPKMLINNSGGGSAAAGEAGGLVQAILAMVASDRAGSRLVEPAHADS